MTQEINETVTPETLRTTLAKHYRFAEGVSDDRCVGWQEVAAKHGVDPYRVCAVGAHEGVLWGQKGIIFSWRFKYCPAFSSTLKGAGVCQFSKYRGDVVWRSRPRSVADLDEVIFEASRHFSVLFDVDAQAIHLSESDSFVATKASDRYPEPRPLANISFRDVLRAAQEVRPEDDFCEGTLKIDDGTQFQSFPSTGGTILMFPIALFSVSARDRQLRTIKCRLKEDGSLAVTDIAFGASDPKALSLIAEHRQKCACRRAYATRAAQR